MGRLVKGAAGAAPVSADGAREHRRGYEDGFAVGREAGVASVTELLAAARADADATRAQARDAAVTLARRMAEKIVGHAVDTSPEVMGEIASRALATARARGAITVRVSPEDLPAVEAARAGWGPRAAIVKLIPDPAVGRYGCVVETAVGRVDARLDAQLEALVRAVSAARGAP